MIIESGATSRVIGERSLLQDTMTYAPVTISLGDGRKLTSMMKGSTFIPTSAKRSYTGRLGLCNALNVPKLDSNLLSCRELHKAGYHVIFGGRQCEIRHGGDLVDRAQLPMVFV